MNFKSYDWVSAFFGMWVVAPLVAIAVFMLAPHAHPFMIFAIAYPSGVVAAVKLREKRQKEKDKDNRP